VNNVAYIDPSGCDGCGTCVEKCPTKCIVATREVPVVQAV